MKTSTSNRFDELFRERFKDFGENPPESVFEKLKSTTSGMSNHTPFWKKGSFFATIGIVTFVGISILFINSFSTSNNSKTLNHQITSNNKLTDVDKKQVSSQIDNATILLSNKQNTSNAKTEETITKNSAIFNKDIFSTNDDNKKSGNIPDNSIITKTTPNNNGNENYIVKINIKAATCRKPNGSIALSSNSNKVLFYWTDFNNESPHSTMNNLMSGKYNVKSVSDQGIEQNLVVTVPDSGIIRARFTHYEMTQAIGVPVYFSNKSTVDGVDAENTENTSFKWYFGDGKISTEINPEHMYSSIGPYTVSLVAYSPQGCKDSSSTIPLYIAGSDIEASNIFTPNGDGQNDIFIPAVQALNSYQCTIINRNGQVLYKSSDPTQGWDGKINHGSNIADPGTYFYIIKGVGIDGKIIEQRGTIDLRL